MITSLDDVQIDRITELIERWTSESFLATNDSVRRLIELVVPPLAMIKGLCLRPSERADTFPQVALPVPNPDLVLEEVVEVAPLPPQTDDFKGLIPDVLTQIGEYDVDIDEIVASELDGVDQSIIDQIVADSNTAQFETIYTGQANISAPTVSLSDFGGVP